MRLRLLAVLLLTSACGTGTGAPPAALSSPGATPSPETGCDGEPLPPRRSSLVALDVAGTERFTVHLPAAGDSPQAPPLEDAQHVYVVAGGSVRALDRAHGQERWSRPVDGPLYGMWLDSGLLVLLIDQVSDRAHAVGLDPTDGSQRWRHDVPGRGLLGSQVPTGDGGLAWIAAGRTEVLDLTSGRIRWAAEGAGQDAALAAAQGIVVRGVAGGVRAYDARDGRVRWTAGDLTDGLVLHVQDSTLVVGQGTQGIGYDGSVDAFDLATGTRRWEVAEDEPLGVGGVGSGGVVLFTQTSGAPTFRLVRLEDGGSLWSARTQIALHLPAVVRADNVVTVEGGTSQQPETALVGRRTDDGVVAWSSDLEQPSSPPLPVGPDAVLVMTSRGSDQTAVVVDVPSGGRLAEVPLEGYVQRPGANERGILLQAADPERACAGDVRGPARPSPAPAR